MTTAPPMVSRRDVRRALRSAPWVEPLMFSVGPVFALLAVVASQDQSGMAGVWGSLAIVAPLVAVFSFVEQRRRVSFVHELCRRSRELAAQGVEHDGAVLGPNTELRSYPMQASFLVVSFTTATCPSTRPRGFARGFAIAVNLLVGWWSPAGLITTPINLWRCIAGGTTTTPFELVSSVAVLPRPNLARRLSDRLALFITACVVLVVIVGICAVVIHFSD